MGCLEFCTSENSNLTKLLDGYGKTGVRLTPSCLDCSDDEQISVLIQQIKEADVAWDLFGSIPCDPWSTWQAMNLHIHGEPYAKDLEKRRAESRKILANFIRLTKTIRERGGRVAFEWPRHASGWKLPELQQLIVDLNLYIADCDGCAFGMTDRANHC